jgi:outer membrane protein OmpA-like peptidoglycan-associated protein
MTRSSSILASLFVGAGLGLFTLAPAHAQDAVYLRDDASHCEIFRSVSRVVPGHCAQAGDRGLATDPSLGPSQALRTRSIRQAPAAAPGVTAQVAAVEQAAPPPTLAFAMRVQFEFDSFNLTPEAKRVLDRIAAVLNDDLMAQTVVKIEGHTDAHGHQAYNLTLSQLRARSVRAYLIQDHGVEPERLPFAGHGKSRPFDGRDPFNGINRRVEFHNVTG